jgi:hypothetical protein
MRCRWHKNSIFGDGPRAPLDRERRAQFRALLHLNRRPGRLSQNAAQLGRVLVDMLGADGRLDPSHETLAARAGMALATVKRCLGRLQALGFLSWARRLVRGSGTGWRAEQTSNAYALSLPPACEAHFAPAVRSVCISKKGQPETVAEADREAVASRDRQLRALGFPVPAARPEEGLLTNKGFGPAGAR